MYLNRLSGEQKELFLDLCIYASKADGIFAEEEKQYIQQYCIEMQLETVRYSAQNDLESVIKKITEVSTDIDLKIIFFEISALVLSDNTFDKQEQNLVDKLTAAFQLGTDFKEKALAQLKNLMNVYGEVNRLLFESI